MERLIDLNGLPRASVTIEIGGKSFQISRVVTGVRQLYGRFLTEAGAMMENVADLNEKIQAGKISPEGLREADAEIEQRTAEVERFAAEKLDVLLRCIELLLVKNGYEFDREWWIENGDEMDYQSLIVEALGKDSTPGQKKTEGEGA